MASDLYLFNIESLIFLIILKIPRSYEKQKLSQHWHHISELEKANQSLLLKEFSQKKKITSKAIFGCVAKDHSRAIFLKEYGSLSWVLLGYQVVYINFLISKTWN